MLIDQDREEIDPEAHDMDLYAPVHEYVFRVHGGILGVFDGWLLYIVNCATRTS